MSLKSPLSSLGQRYAVLESLGSGGAGEVVGVHDRLLGRNVAVKRLRRSSAAAERALRDEYATLAALDHPGVVRALGLTRTREGWALVTEWVEGVRLDRWLDGGPERGVVRSVFVELLHTLAWLHVQGVVHADIKPANILVQERPDGAWPILIDFGVAAIGDRRAAVGGTPAFMAPELLRRGAKRPDAGTDLFALGRCFEDGARTQLPKELAALTPWLSHPEPGARPSTAAEVLDRLGARARPIRQIATALPKPWKRVVTGLMEAARGGESYSRCTGAESDLLVVARDLTTRLEIQGVPLIRLAHEAGVVSPLMERLADALGRPMELKVPRRAHDHGEVLDALAVNLAEGLAAAGQPVLVLVTPERWLERDRRVLSRLLEMKDRPPCLLFSTDDWEGPFPVIGEPGHRDVALPSSARAEAADLLEGVEAPLLETLAHLYALGGQATIGELSVLAPRGASIEEHLAVLAAARLTASGRPGEVAIVPPVLDRLEAGSEEVPDLDGAQAKRHIKHLESAASIPRLRARARLHETLGQPRQAAKSWGMVADLATARLETGLAGESALRAAELGQDFERCAQAAHLLEVVGRREGVDQALVLARAAPSAAGEHALELVLLEARSSLLTGDASGAARRAGDVLNTDGLSDLHVLDASLIRGSARTSLGELELAAEDLGRAADLAERTGDLHGAARAANNLGNARLGMDDLDGAAAAYERSARLKEVTGDVRGRRVALSNRALALRHQGRLGEAASANEEAQALAERVGDLRGRTTTHLVAGLLALDLGDVERAEMALEAAEDLPHGSVGVELNLASVRARLLWAQEKYSAAASASEGVATRAAEVGVCATAWQMELLALHSSLHQIADDGDLVPILEGLEALCEDGSASLSVDDRWLWTGALAWALAAAGQWGRARHEIRSFLQASTAPPGPDGVRGLGAFWRAATLVSEREALGRLARDAATCWDRVAKAHSLLATTGPSTRTLSALDLQELIDPENLRAAQVDRLLHPQETVMGDDTTNQDRGLTLALAGLQEGDASALSTWARALQRASGAPAVALTQWVAGEADLLARWPEDADLTALLPVAKRVERRGEIFAARAADGAIEAMGIPLRTGAAALVDGAALFQWPGGTGEAADGIETRVRALGKIAALAVRSHRLDNDCGAAQDRARRLTEESEILHQEHAEELMRLRDELHHTQSEERLRHSYDRIVHQSRAMNRVLSTLDKVTASDLPVLVLGESGVGKEVLSRTLHHNGPRQSGPFVAENCGAVPMELFESVFFGHVRGAFTGANTNRRGLVEQANGGTLFLDEVGELRPEHQVKLLRVLQESSFRPVGGSKEIEADFRLIAATNRDLEAMVAAGEFREDLYYRMSVVHVNVPPLRERRADILPLATMLLGEQGEREGRTLTLAPAAADLLVAYAWPGNVRELENELLRASVLASGSMIAPKHFSERVRGRQASAASREGGLTWDGQQTLKEVTASLEREILHQALAMTRGKKAAVARLLDISRPGLDAKLARLEIDAKAYRASGQHPTMESRT